ncbi:hypothetical protein ACI2KO_02745 [Pseudomonas piscis]|uniref:hypothetical protein n=1 Tax=Pseudomonas piscis TaxID=2614538 RepID=UPI00384FD6CF
MDTRKLSTMSSAASVDHGGGANTSSPCSDLAMAYGRALLRLKENHFHCVPVSRHEATRGGNNDPYSGVM